jgi:hypothetical protein
VKFWNSKKRKNNGLEGKKGSSAGTLGRVQNQVKSKDCQDRMGHARRGSCRQWCIDEIYALSLPITVVGSKETTAKVRRF